VREADRPGTFLQPAQIAKAREAGPKMIDMLRRMHAAGVKIAFGTDTGVSAHGDNAQEFALMVKAGMTPMQTIRQRQSAPPTISACRQRSALSQQAKRRDIIAVNGDPLANVRELESVDFVMKGREGLQAVGARSPRGSAMSDRRPGRRC
jgi:imidazolonepropionase-like amidohydrolase